jgi:hypothetical protein
MQRASFRLGKVLCTMTGIVRNLDGFCQPNNFWDQSFGAAKLPSTENKALGWKMPGTKVTNAFGPGDANIETAALFAEILKKNA